MKAYTALMFDTTQHQCLSCGNHILIMDPLQVLTLLSMQCLDAGEKVDGYCSVMLNF